MSKKVLRYKLAIWRTLSSFAEKLINTKSITVAGDVNMKEIENHESKKENYAGKISPINGSEPFDMGFSKGD